MAPKKLKSQIKEVVIATAVQALAVVKSHYPRVDLQWIKEGFAEDTDEDKMDALLLDVKSTSDLLVENLDLDFM